MDQQCPVIPPGEPRNIQPWWQECCIHPFFHDWRISWTLGTYQNRNCPCKKPPEFWGLEWFPHKIQCLLHPRKHERPSHSMAVHCQSQWKTQPPQIHLKVQKQHSTQQHQKWGCLDQLLLLRNPNPNHEKNLLHGHCPEHHRKMVHPGPLLQTCLGKDQQDCEELRNPFLTFLDNWNTNNTQKYTWKKKDPNTMDVDTIHIEKLIPEEWQRCFDNNLCFKCCRPGYVATKCQNSYLNKLKQPTATTAKIKEIPNVNDSATVGRISTMDF